MSTLSEERRRLPAEVADFTLQSQELVAERPSLKPSEGQEGDGLYQDPDKLVDRLVVERDRLLRKMGTFLDVQDPPNLGTSLLPCLGGTEWRPVKVRDHDRYIDPLEALKDYNRVTRAVRKVVSAVMANGESGPFQHIADLDSRLDPHATRISGPRIAVLSDPGSVVFASRAAAFLGIRKINYRSDWQQFRAGEWNFRTEQDPKHTHYILISRPSAPNHDTHIQWLKQMLKVTEGGASRSVIMEHVPYERQDKNPADIAAGPIMANDGTAPRFGSEAATLKMLLEELKHYNIDRLVVNEFHPRNRGDFLERAVELDNSARYTFGAFTLIPHARRVLDIGTTLNRENAAVYAPDASRDKHAQFMSKSFDLPSFYLDKQRGPDGEIERIQVTGIRCIPETVISIDDIIDSGSTQYKGVIDVAQKRLSQFIDDYELQDVGKMSLDEVVRYEKELVSKFDHAGQKFTSHLVANTAFFTNGALEKLNRCPFVGRIMVGNTVENGRIPVPIEDPLPLKYLDSDLTLPEYSSQSRLTHVCGSTRAAEVLFRIVQDIHAVPNISLSQTSNMMVDESGWPPFWKEYLHLLQAAAA